MSRHVHVHFSDHGFRWFDFEESKVHRGGDPKNAGRFSKGSGSGGGGQKGEGKPSSSASSARGGHPGGQTTTRPFQPGGQGGGSQPYSQPYTQTGQGEKPKPEAKGKSDIHGDLGRHVTQHPGAKQNVRDVDDLYEKAEADEASFVNSVKDTAKLVGGDAKFGRNPDKPNSTLKGRARAMFKINGDYDGDASQLQDVLRGTVATTTVEQARTAALEFLRQHPNDIVKVKDRFASTGGDGYRDIMIKYMTPSGLIAEIQFNAKNMIEAKKAGHRWYAVSEAIKRHEKKTGFSHPQAIETLAQRCKSLYDQAYQSDGNGNWAMSGTHDADQNRIVRPYYHLARAGKDFYAKIVYTPRGPVVYSTRNGDWEPDAKLSWGDLPMPEFKLYDWDVEGLDTLPDDAPNDTTPADSDGGGEPTPAEETEDGFMPRRRL